MSKNLYEATLLQLKGRALEAYAALDLLLNNPTGIPDHSNWVDEIIKHTQILTTNENAMITLQQYFAKRYAAPTPPPPTESVLSPSTDAPKEKPLVVTPERSPTLRRELEKQKMLEAAKQRRQKKRAQKELYPKSDKEPVLTQETKDDEK